MTWLHVLLEWPFTAAVALAVGTGTLVSWLAVAAVRRIPAHARFQGNNELVGFTYSVYGVVYGVLLAFTIIVAWDRFEDTETLVMQEATLLSEIWRDSRAFDPAMREEIQRELTAYAQSVVDDEWPSMAKHGQPSANTEEIYAACGKTRTGLSRRPRTKKPTSRRSSRE